MKVFQVVTEHIEGKHHKVITTHEYVTSEEDTLKFVTDFYTEHCYQYDKELKSVSEILVIRHLKSEDMK